MIVYKELSSLLNDLGVSPKELYYVSNNTSKLYRKVEIPKANGEMRTLYVPNGFLKSIHSKILNKLLIMHPVSPYATAYRYGSSPIKNARFHLGKEKILKLDIAHFFDSITYPLIKEKVFTSDKYSESNRVLLSLICVYKDSLPQGAPTSPAVSNIILKDFDDTVGEFCRVHSITYTRYCDDMTFSGSFDDALVKSFVAKELKKYGFFLNDKKTVVAKNGQKKVVTGIVINDKANVQSEYRRSVRQEVYYIKRFGLDSHLKRKNEPDKKKYLNSLFGRINYTLAVDPLNSEFKGYKSYVLTLLNNLKCN